MSGDILRMNETFTSYTLTSLVYGSSLVKTFQYSSTLAVMFQLKTEAADDRIALFDHVQCCDDSDLRVQVETMTISAMPSPHDLTATLPAVQSSPSGTGHASPLPITHLNTSTPNKLSHADLLESAETGSMKAKSPSHTHSGILTQDSGLGHDVMITHFKEYLHSKVSCFPV